MARQGAMAEPGRYAYDGLDRNLHEKARLGIMTSLLARPEGLLFNDLKQLCRLTDGNLSRHIQVLREARLVEVWKGHDRRRPQTLYRLTALGRHRFVDYLGELEKVIRDASAARAQRPSARAADESEGSDLSGLPVGWVPG